MKHLAQDCPAPLCSDCGKDHHVLICPNERTEQKLHKAQGDEEDDDGSEDEDYYQGGDLFDDDQQFHFNQGPEYDDGDDYQDHYQSDDSRGEETDRDESTLNVERTMFAKSFGSDNNLGDGMLKSISMIRVQNQLNMRHLTLQIMYKQAQRNS